MSGHTPWHEVKAKIAAVVDRKMGTRFGFAGPDEICPGLTREQHAESLAMFQARNYIGSNKFWHYAVEGMTQANLDLL